MVAQDMWHYIELCTLLNIDYYYFCDVYRILCIRDIFSVIYFWNLLLYLSIIFTCLF